MTNQSLPTLAAVRDVENPDPAPVAPVPAQTFELTPPEESAHSQTRIDFGPVDRPAAIPRRLLGGSHESR
jgi:hypothetical protein